VTKGSKGDRVFKEESRTIAVVSSPFIHLSEQWIRELNKLNIDCHKIIADSSRNRWKDRLVDSLIDAENNIIHRLVILTTHNTFSSHDFVSIMKASKQRKPSQKLLLISDEVHGIGAPIRKEGLIHEYDYRLGLSATPKRWFDSKGTDLVFEYFGGVVFTFSLKEAIKAGYLTPYIYIPCFSSLTPEEMTMYEEDTRKISRAYTTKQKK